MSSIDAYDVALKKIMRAHADSRDFILIAETEPSEPFHPEDIDYVVHHSEPTSLLGRFLIQRAGSQQRKNK